MTEPSDKALKRVTTRLSVVERRLSYIENRLGIDGARATSEANYDQEVRQVVRAEAASAKHVSKSQSSQPQVPEKPVELPLFKIFGAVGFLFIILGLYYLYRWGVEQGFLTYGVRIALGIIAGLSVVAIGEWVRTRKIPQYGELLIGGGLAITYFTVYAAYYFEQVRAALGMNLYVDAVLLFAITALGVWLAFRANSSLLTGFTFFLGYVTAFLLPQGHLSIVSGIILSAGLWIILGAKQWNFGFAPVSAAWMVFFTSVGVLLTSNILAASVYAIIIFALFVTLALRYGKEDDTIVVSIILINSVLALFAGLLIMKQYEALRGVFVFVFAAVHFILWLLCETRRSAAATVYLLLAIAFITIAIPIQLDRSWVTILWAIQGALLVFVGLKYDSLGIRSTGYAVLSIALARFLFFDTWTLSGSERLVTGLFVVIALSMSGYMLQARADLMKKYGRLAPDMVTIVAVASAACFPF